MYKIENFDIHIEKSLERLTSDFYALENVYKKYGGEDGYDWPGDYEGRFLLALSGLEKITGKKIPRLEEYIALLPEKLNEKGYFGIVDEKLVDEQALLGHNWFLRGLVKCYELYNDESFLEMAKTLVKNFFLAVCPAFEYYPDHKREEKGGTAGNLLEEKNGWKLSTDVGAAFACIDGLAHYYAKTKDQEVLSLLDMMIAKFISLDKIALKMQTHSTLTATHGIFVLYKVTGNKKYYDMVNSIFDLYVKNGMTYTYENFNWFGRKDTWTEPCAEVDSLILAVMLYKETADERYKTLARRIWFNGLRFAHRDNGGAGTASCVYEENNEYKMLGYEAFFCCTMRYCEALETISANRELFDWEPKEVEKDELGRSFIDDCLLVSRGGEKILMPTMLFTTEEEAQKLVFKICE